MLDWPQTKCKTNNPGFPAIGNVTAKGVTIKTLNHKSRLQRPAILMTGILATCLVLMLAVGCAQQQAGSLDEQMAIAKAGNEAINQLNWAEYAKLLHTEALDSFKTTLLQPIEIMARANNATDSISLFGTTQQLENLRNSTSEEFFTNLMTNLFTIVPDLGATFSGMDNRIVGAVAEGDSLVHVVMQTKMVLGDRTVDEMNVVTLKQDQGEWKLQLSNKIEGVIMLVQQSLLQRRG
ncbi:MAG: hypothetical protein E4G91_08415 [Candidatus Zixiibacteriota bacterium]|nr:MAG: hypothetical protein E4G91_08415 [candidate division Zixibacteria bacterium]